MRWARCHDREAEPREETAISLPTFGPDAKKRKTSDAALPRTGNGGGVTESASLVLPLADFALIAGGAGVFALSRKRA